MRAESRDRRKQEIEAAAYEVLAEKGYRATSMLAIAKRASASNETLYRWYGNKQALFLALVEENARSTREFIEASLDADNDPLETLDKLGENLLRVVTSEKAVALNRAAAADVYDTSTLGKTIVTAGKETIVPLIVTLLERAKLAGQLSFDDPQEAGEIYVRLLIGDLQIQRVIGVQSKLNADEITQRATRAYQLFRRLFATNER